MKTGNWVVSENPGTHFNLYLPPCVKFSLNLPFRLHIHFSANNTDINFFFANLKTWEHLTCAQYLTTCVKFNLNLFCTHISKLHVLLQEEQLVSMLRGETAPLRSDYVTCSRYCLNSVSAMEVADSRWWVVLNVSPRRSASADFLFFFGVCALVSGVCCSVIHSLLSVGVGLTGDSSMSASSCKKINSDTLFTSLFKNMFLGHIKSQNYYYQFHIFMHFFLMIMMIIIIT